MGIGVLVSMIPWKEILVRGPAIVDSARGLYETLKNAQDSPSKIADLQGRVDQVDQIIADLKSRDTQQADLISRLAGQAQVLSDGLRVTAARVALLLWISVAALLLAIAVAVKEFLF